MAARAGDRGAAADRVATGGRVTEGRPAPGYAELQCQSAFSFLRGSSEPETLVARATELGYAALALTDRDGLSGHPRFHLAAKKEGLRGLHGVTLTLARPGEAVDEADHGTQDAATKGRTSARPAAGRRVEPDGSPATADDRVVLLAEDDAGWSSLCRLVSAARKGSRTAPTTTLETLAGHATGLLALAGPHLAEESLAALVEAFGRGRSYLVIHDRLLHRDRRGQLLQRERGARYGIPRVVTGGVRLARRSDKPVHDVLTCVRHKVTLDEAATRLLPNAEFCLRPVAELQRLFRHDLPALRRTLEVAERCRFALDRLAYRFPPCRVPPGETPFSHLHRLVHEGARRRYRPLHAAAARQVARELDLIERLDLAGYFLIVHEITAFCEARGILCQGRGSAANSAVCYALGITSVDPVGMGLLFERFLSENRGEMPDIDLDIEHERREEVLQWVYARHGRERAAIAGEIITWRPRSAVRDAGRALGFSVAEVDALAKGIDRRWDNDPGAVPEAWSDRRDDPRLPHLLKLVAAMDGLPRHVATHVGGMIVTGPPLTDVMPVEPAAMPGRTIVPWDKDDLAALGILKIDLLGLGMLTVLRKGFELVNRFAAGAGVARALPGGGAGPGGDLREAGAAEPLALHTVPGEDAATWDLLCAADTVGVFQVESRAQMNCLPRLRPRRFYDLVVEVALIRPGPIQGDMVHPYLRRRAGREAVDYPHPSLRPILERTLGVPLFQEQGMRIAMEAGGFSGGEADELRRAMGHKRSRSRMAALADKLVGGLVAHGLPREAAERVLHQLSAFADYGFPESHAASFARLAWASAWMKCHHPAAFLCALLNSQPMGFYAPAVLVSDARRHGVPVLPVDVTCSDWDSTLQWVEGAPGGDAGRGGEAKRGSGAARDPAGPRGTGHSAPVTRTGAESGVPDTAWVAEASEVSASADDVREGPSGAPAGRYPCGTAGGERLPRGGRGEPGGPGLAVRLGLCTVRGIGPAQEPGVRAGLASLLDRGPFVSPEDFARRTGLDQARMEHLARLGALDGFESRRRHALWRVQQMARRVPGALAEPLGPEGEVVLPAQTEAERLCEDYALGGISVQRHPLELLRARLVDLGVRRAEDLRAGARPGGEAWVAGLVICRQRPTTAKGLTFVTLEDETGFVNLVVRPEVAARDRAGLFAALTLATGRIECADGVVNLQAERLVPLDAGLPLRGVPSHDWR